MDPRTYLLALLSVWGFPATATAVLVAEGPEFQANTYTTDDQTDPDVSPDGAAGFVVVWESLGQDGARRGVFGQRFDADAAAVGSEFQVNDFITDDQDDPVTAAGPGGSFVVVWESRYQDGDGNGVFGRMYDSAGLPAADAFQVSSVTAQDQSDPGLVSAADGSFVVAFESDDSDASRDGVALRCHDAAGMALGPDTQVNTFTIDEQGDPVVAGAPDGRFVVVWESAYQDGDGLGVFGQRYDAACVPLGTEFAVNTYTTGSQSDHAAAMDAAGRFVVVWESDSQDGSGRGVFARLFESAGRPAGTEFRVNTYTTGAQDNADVSVGDDGSYLIVWTADNGDGSGRGVRARLFDRDGVADGDELQVNVYTTGNQDSPDVAARDGGGFVVVWSGADRDGSGFGIFGRRLATDGRFAACGDASEAVGFSVPSTSRSRSLVTATDALVVLQVAVGVAECAACVCDVDASGAVTTTDALFVLQRSLDDSVVLGCPPCEVLE